MPNKPKTNRHSPANLPQNPETTQPPAPSAPVHAEPADTLSLAPAEQGPPPGHIIDRRLWTDRRDVRVEGQTPDFAGLERRRGVGRRLSDFTRSAEEGELTKEQFLFLMAIESFKKSNNKSFPTWTDVLEVVRLLGYRKTMPMELGLRNAEDWREMHNAPSNVRAARWHEKAA